MKTQLPAEIKNESEARNFLLSLYLCCFELV